MTFAQDSASTSPETSRSMTLPDILIGPVPPGTRSATRRAIAIALALLSLSAALARCAPAASPQASTTTPSPALPSASPDQTTNDDSDSEPETLTLGIKGHVKLGVWVPVFVTPENPIPPGQAITFEVSTLDGNDLPVTYRGPAIRRGNRFECWARIGRQYGNFQVQLRDSADQMVAQHSLNMGSTNRIQAIGGTRNLIVTLESGTSLRDAFQAIGNKDALGHEQTVLACASGDDLPSTWLTMESISVLAISTSDLDVLSSISDEQWNAIHRWVRCGGRLLILGGQHGQEALATTGLKRFLPIESSENVPMENSWQLEAYANSRDPLIPADGDPVTITRLLGFRGVTEKLDRDVILAARAALGFGEVIFSAVAIDVEPVVSWPGQRSLLARLLNRPAASESAPQVVSSRVSHYGFQDITGQLRLPLEQFSRVQFINFTWIALLIGLYILCIGPGDYFLLKNVLGRMEYTWLTFSLVTLAFCGLAVVLADWSKPDQIQINQLEIIDIDASEGIARGTIWGNVFSPRTGEIRAELEPENRLGLDLKSDAIVTWQGLPGTGLGGMQTRAGAGLFRRHYVVEFDSAGPGDAPMLAHLARLPVQVSSTRPLYAQFLADSPLSIRANLFYDDQIQRISGTITNPLDEPIRNVRLMFETWTYRLDRPLEPGETIDVETELRETTAKNYLTQRVRESNKGRNAPWDPTDQRMPRIADMLMFYDLAGGHDYTGLTHDYQPFVEMSRHLNLNRAILVGELDQRVAQFAVSDLATGQQGEYDRSATLIRIVLPVRKETTSEPNR